MGGRGWGVRSDNARDNLEGGRDREGSMTLGTRGRGDPELRKRGARSDGHWPT